MDEDDENPEIQQQKLYFHQLQQQVHIFRLVNDDLLDAMEHELKGEVKTKDGWKQLKEPWANEEGANKILSILRSIGLNKGITLGYLIEDQIKDRCRLVWNKMAYMMCVNYYKYGIERSHRSILIQMIVQQVHSSLTRSLFGKEAKQISSTSQHVEQVLRQDKPLPKSESILERVNPFKRRGVY